MVSYKLRWFACSKTDTVTHPRIYRTRRRATTLIGHTLDHYAVVRMTYDPEIELKIVHRLLPLPRERSRQFPFYGFLFSS